MPIERMRIPNEDVPNWIQTLREGGFSDEEVDSMMSLLNKEYAKGAGIDLIEEELEKIEKHLREVHRRILTKEQRTHLRKSISERPEFNDAD